MDGSEPVTIRFRFDDYGSPRWTVTIGEEPNAAVGEGSDLADAAWKAQMVRRELDDSVDVPSVEASA